MRVISWQSSGVAWVPWRIGSCLAACASERVEYLATGLGVDRPHVESYGLPALHATFPDPWTAAAELRADVVHLHHECASRAVVPQIRSRLPKVRVLVTLHGEPDRSIGRCADSGADAYHVVEPGLLRFVEGRARVVRFLPNHPGWSPGPRATQRRPRSIWCPASHVAGFKDREVFDYVASILESDGWAIYREPSILRNSSVLAAMGTYGAVWNHLRGYLDLLTMEAWSVGCVPVTAPPDPRLLDAWTAALGARPPLLLEGSDSSSALVIARRLRERDVGSIVAEGHRLMSEVWTPAACGRAWAAFLEEVAG